MVQLTSCEVITIHMDTSFPLCILWILQSRIVKYLVKEFAIYMAEAFIGSLQIHVTLRSILSAAGLPCQHIHGYTTYIPHIYTHNKHRDLDLPSIIITIYSTFM